MPPRLELFDVVFNKEFYRAHPLIERAWVFSFPRRHVLASFHLHIVGSLFIYKMGDNLAWVLYFTHRPGPKFLHFKILVNSITIT